MSAQHLGSDCTFQSFVRGGRSRWKWPIPPTLTDPSSVLKLKSSPPPTIAPCPGLASPVPNSPIRATWEACDGHARYQAAPIYPRFKIEDVSAKSLCQHLLLVHDCWCRHAQIHLILQNLLSSAPKDILILLTVTIHCGTNAGFLCLQNKLAPKSLESLLMKSCHLSYDHIKLKTKLK